MWKDLWDVALGVAYIPIDKLDPQTDLVRLIFMNHNELHEIFKGNARAIKVNCIYRM